MLYAAAFDPRITGLTLDHMLVSYESITTPPAALRHFRAGDSGRAEAVRPAPKWPPPWRRARVMLVDPVNPAPETCCRWMKRRRCTAGAARVSHRREGRTAPLTRFPLGASSSRTPRKPHAILGLTRPRPAMRVYRYTTPPRPSASAVRCPRVALPQGAAAPAAGARYPPRHLSLFGL